MSGVRPSKGAAGAVLFRLLPLLALACSPPSAAPRPAPVGGGGEPVDTATAGTPLPPWIASGEEGSVVYRHRAQGGELPEDHLIVALFGADLQGLVVPPLCAVEGELCWQAAAPGAVVEPEPFAFDPAAAELAWMGHTLGIGDLDLPHVYEADSGLAYYRRALPDFPDEPALDVTMDGEWGAWTGVDLLEPPSPFTVEGRDPAVFVDLTRGPVTFAWDEPGEVHVEVTGPDLHELHRVDGAAFTFDPAALLPFGDGEIVTFDLHRVERREVEVNGNSLQAVGVSSVRFRGGSAEPASCKGWQSVDPGAPSGVYPIQPSPEGPIFDVWCDMETDGGGWTLVAASAGAPLDDAAGTWHADLTALVPSGARRTVWGGLRPIVTGPADLRFACKLAPSDAAMAVDLSFYDVPWYREITTGSDAASCFNEGDGAGADPAPARRDNLTGDERLAGDPWAAGYLEGEDSCGAEDDFTVDLDDRGIDSDQSDGTDWGEDDGAPKCATSGTFDAAWFLFVRE